METRVVVLLFIIFSFYVNHLRGVESITFKLKNNCAYTVWPATQSGATSPTLSSTGLELANGATLSIEAPTHWSGRFWARSLCHFDLYGNFRCSTGDCGSGKIQCNGAGGTPPATLAEFTLAGDMGKDFYDISLVDGFNIPISVIPQPRPRPRPRTQPRAVDGASECPTTSCSADVNAKCPEKLAVKSPNGSDNIGCKSACVVFKEPQYCCTGEYSTPQRCLPTNYSLYFKNECPQAYSYAYDDSTSTFTCPTGVDYLITFCP